MGGEDFDNRVISRHFVQGFQEKYKINISSNATALTRLGRVYEEAKRDLSCIWRSSFLNN